MKQKGIALIEVVVAIFILSVGLLGLASLQFMSLKNMQMAEKADSANVYLQQIAEAMRSNKTALSSFEGSAEIGEKTTLSCQQNCGYDVAAEMALARIKNALADQFSGATLQIEKENNLGAYTLSEFSTDRQGNTTSIDVTYSIDIYEISLSWQEQGSFLLKTDALENRQESIKVTL